MVLKNAVNDVTGQLLLGEGVEIISKHITILKTWGVTEVEIEGDAQGDAVEDALTQVDEEALHNAEKELQKLFGLADLENSSVTKEIFRLTVRHKAEMLGGA